MKKGIVIIFGISLLSLSFYSLLTDSYFIPMFMGIDLSFVWARIALVMVLLLYAFVPSLRFSVTRTLLSLSGFVMLLLGILSIGSPSLLGNANAYVLLGDSFTLIEGGILAIILSTELSVQKPQYIMNTFKHMRLILTEQETNFNQSLQKSSVAAPVSKQ